MRKPGKSSTPLSDHQRQLAEKWYGLAVKLSRERFPGHDWDVVCTHAHDSLMLAAATYEPGRGCTSFTSWLVWCSRRVQLTTPRQRRIAAATRILTRRDLDGLLQQVTPWFDDRDEYERLTATLSLRERVMLRLRAEGLTEPEQAEIWGVSHQACHSCMARAMSLMASCAHRRTRD